jgi:hypothetical protein
MQPNEPVTPEQTQPVTPPMPEQQSSAPVQPAQQSVATPTPPVDPESMQINAPEQQISVEQPTVQPDAPTELPAIQPVTWQASEYIQHDKSPLWYILFTVVVCVFVGAAIFLQAWTFVVLIPVMAVALMVYTHRPPHVISYALSEKGLYINDMLHPMGEFKAFSIAQSANPQQNQLVLTPVKRFRPSLTIFFPSEVGEELVDIMGAYLPDQPYKLDAFDKIIQKLRI